MLEDFLIPFMCLGSFLYTGILFTFWIRIENQHKTGNTVITQPVDRAPGSSKLAPSSLPFERESREKSRFRRNRIKRARCRHQLDTSINRQSGKLMILIITSWLKSPVLEYCKTNWNQAKPNWNLEYKQNFEQNKYDFTFKKKPFF